MSQLQTPPIIKAVLKVIYENVPCLNTFLFQRVCEIINPPKDKRKQLSDKIRYIIKVLEKHGYVITHRIDKRTYEIIPIPQKTDQQNYLGHQRKAIDLISFRAARKSPEEGEQEDQNKEKVDIDKAVNLLFTPSYTRMHPFYFDTARKYWRFSYVPPEEQDNLAKIFHDWKEDVSQKLLIFCDDFGNIQALPYRTRFTSKAKAFEILKKAEEVFNAAFKRYDKAVFLTITLPHIFPLKLAMWILSFIHHRIKAYLREKTGQNVEHIRVNEPQKKLVPHIHDILLGIDHLMWKRDLTRYLDKHLENFLSRLGEHYKQTINKRINENEVKALNKLGKRFLKKYRRYKSKKRKYEGLINWVSKITIEKGKPCFENPPPDYYSFSETENGQNNEKPPVWDYLKKYLVKNMLIASKKIDDPEERIKAHKKLAFYWILRIPFFSCSPTLRPRKEKPPPSGWIFLFSTTIEYYEDAIQMADYLLNKYYGIA